MKYSLKIIKWMDIIIYIYNHPGCTKSMINKHTHITANHSQPFIKLMANAQWLRVDYNKKDTRYHHHYLTDTGKEVAACALKIRNRIKLSA